MRVSSWVVLLAVVAAVNPLRLWPSLPRGERPRAERLVVAGGGGALAGAGLVALAVAGGSIADALDVSAPTVGVAAGLVLAVGALWGLVVGPPAPEPSLAARGAAVVPVAVPFVLRPEAGLVAVAAGADGRAGWVVAGCVVVVAALLGGAAPSTLGGAAERVARWGGRVVAAVGVALGISLAVAGVLAV